MQKVKEIFYFIPQNVGFNPDSISEVHLIGEFNNWGDNKDELAKYKLTKDKNNRWVGFFKVKAGTKPYKFLLNRQTHCPGVGQLYYSTVLTPEWAKRAIWYQIFPDRFNRVGDTPVNNFVDWESEPDYFNNFGGTFKGIEEKIPYFKNLYGDLNNFALYLNPITLSVASNHKYWPEDYKMVDPQFGSEKDFKNLVKALKKEGARVITDLVYNHAGINFFAFRDLLYKGPKSKYKDWFRNIPDFINEKIQLPVLEGYIGEKPSNIEIINDPRSESYNNKQESYISIWGGKYKFPIINPQDFKGAGLEDILHNQPYYNLVGTHSKANYNCWWDFFEIPDLNTENRDVKNYLINAAKKFVKMGVDGFRLDVPDYLNDAHGFWAEFRKEVKRACKNPDDLYITGEIWTDARTTNSYISAKDKNNRPLRFDAVMNYQPRENILNCFTDDILVYAMDNISHKGELSVFDMDINLHKNIAHFSWGTDLVQMNNFSSHDARRLRTALNNDNQLKIAFMMQFTLPGAPCIYYGDEIAMSGGSDPDCRKPMKWDIIENLDSNQFSKEIFELHKKLIQLRVQNDCFTDMPIYSVLVDDEKKLYAYARHNKKSTVITIVAKNGVYEDIHLDIKGLPFESIKNWQNVTSCSRYENRQGHIFISKNEFSDNNSYGIVIQG